MMKTISFLNIKGGVGKTTTSFNTAAGIAEHGHKVLLIDYDPQSNTTSIFLKETPEITINELMKNGGDTASAMIHVGENLWLIPSSLTLGNTEIDLRIQTIGAQHNRLQKILKQVEDKFDYCIIDCAPIINLLTVNAIIASDELVVPIKPDRFALQGFSVTTDSINNIRESFELDLDYKVLFTIVNRNNEEKKIIDAVRRLVETRVFKAQIRNQPKPIAEASNNSNFVIKNKDANVAQDLRDFVDELMGRGKDGD